METKDRLLQMSEDDRLLSAIVNSYYVLMETADLLQRRAERILFDKGKGYNREMKLRHKQMMDYVRKCRNLQERFFEDYKAAFGNNWNNYDTLRHSANYIARLTLLIGDRSYNSTDIEKQIELFIQALPQQGLVSDEQVLEFQMK